VSLKYQIYVKKSISLLLPVQSLRYNLSMNTYLELLKQAISYRSVSTDSQFALQIEGMVTWLSETFQAHNFKVDRLEGYGNPIILASYIPDPQLQTCLIYGHYDVQPASIEEGWHSEPFEVHEDNQRIYARGIVDNKGQFLVHVATIFDLIKQNKLQYNIKFLIEGNEETGSPLISKCISDHKDKLKSDFVMISDGEISGQTPLIELGFRGGANSTLTIQTATNDLHSGIYGGAAPSAAHEMAKFIATIYDKDNRITVPNFYNDVLPVEKTSAEFDKHEYEKITGAKATLTEPDYDVPTQVGLRPTIQVTGLHTGYTGDGYRNSIPATAMAKINFRLVKNQNPKEIVQQFKKYIADTLPDYVTHTFEISDPYEGIKLDVNNEYVHAAEKLLEKSFGKKPIRKYSGGGLPIVTLFHEHLKVPQVLVPLGNEDCNMHGANENFDKDILKKALDFSQRFFSTTNP
jgi:acetylornithine deacetylase/succinyl-diaminopimelate desuccinylase-like protein